MDTLRERDEDGAGADAEAGSTSTSRDSTGSAQSLTSLRGRGHTRNAPSTVGTVPTKEREDPVLPAPTTRLHRRMGSQSRERPEVIDIKPPTLRGRSSNNWL